jgi:hypothetical protein
MGQNNCDIIGDALHQVMYAPTNPARWPCFGQEEVKFLKEEATHIDCTGSKSQSQDTNLKSPCIPTLPNTTEENDRPAA